MFCFPIMSLNIVESGYRGQHNLTKEEVRYLHVIDLFGVSASAPPASASALRGCSELQTYLDSDPISQFDDSFSILSWWHDHKRTYHVLSILVKDIMSVHVFTISLESAFSFCGRVIKEHR
jgi:hypothetical protein